MSGDMLDTPENSDLFTRMLRAPLRTQGVIPGVNLRVCDAFDLVNRGASRVRLTVNTKLADRTSHNVVAVLPGTASDEEICFTPTMTAWSSPPVCTTTAPAASF